MGKALIGEGEFALVRRHLDKAIQASASWVGDHDVLAMLTDVAALELDEAAIRHYAPQAEELAVCYDHVLYQAIVHRAWGVAHRLAGEYPQAEARLNKALAIFKRLNTRWHIGRTLFEQGEQARSQDDTVRARQAYTLALSAFKEMKADPDIARVRAAIISLTSSA